MQGEWRKADEKQNNPLRWPFHRKYIGSLSPLHFSIFSDVSKISDGSVKESQKRPKRIVMAALSWFFFRKEKQYPFQRLLRVNHKKQIYIHDFITLEIITLPHRDSLNLWCGIPAIL